ncbi:patatin-like phospholipase family protein [Carboxylicivirga sp. N1Y90]|uniref:patatin-like phospholipase family protein n=1 Tax=Carboxylicivirga fragile TaxID=3417571 RepID=UPI003D35685B|nr:patatin family protein [Marinilabiliaceae bacterium N1Y90]
MDISKTALVLEGGGFRAMFTSGVLDALLKHKVHLPYCIGVSAGAAYGISYVSRQFERNREVNLQYTSDPRYMSWRNFFKKGSLFDWDFVYGEIPNKLIPLNYDAALSTDTVFKVGITNALTGKAEFIKVSDLNKDELMQAVTASSSLPFVSPVAQFNDQMYMDGGISDAIPLSYALKDGNKRAIVVLTRNADYKKKTIRFKSLFRLYYRKYPQLVKAILQRAENYNASLRLIAKLEAEGKVFVIRPNEPMDVSRIENDAQKLDVLYQKGFKQMEDQMIALKTWLNS